MKKSKIILPAVALLTISTVAAASSTVAWFTANRSVTVNTSTVSVYNPESDLKVELAGITNAGTDVAEDNITINMPKYMRDGSVDAINSKVYKKDLNNDTYEALKDSTYYSETAIVNGAGEAQPIYRATSWTMTFTMDGAAADAYAVLIDMTNGVTKFTKNDDEALDINNKHISESFRIAFVAGDQVTVLAPWATATKLTYVTNNAADGDYTNNKVTTNKKAIETSEIDSTSSELTAANGYVGTIGKSTAENTGKLVVTCYAWFEGEDPACILPKDGAAIKTTVSSMLGFYAVRLVEAAA